MIFEMMTPQVLNNIFINFFFFFAFPKQFQNDTILVPRETSWFGYYPDGASSSTPVLPPQKTKLYTEDWIGLKTLDDAGKVRFISVPGGHIEITEEDLVKYVVPYLQNESLFSSEHETI
jgi:palmitoyl-protein thioesterase